MAVHPETAQLCRATFAPDCVDLAIRALESYEGEQAKRVHLSAIRLSEGRLNRLAHWLDAAGTDLGTFLWYAGELQSPEDTPEKQTLAADFMNGLFDRNTINRP